MAAGYDALDDAATAALWGIRNEPNEHIGLLYGDELARSNILSKDSSGNVKGTFSIPAGSLRAIFHNHPFDKRVRERERSKFSQDDAEQALKVGVPSYISAGDRVMRYDPTTGKVDEVLAEFPWEEQRRQVMVEILGRDENDPLGALR